MSADNTDKAPAENKTLASPNQRGHKDLFLIEGVLTHLKYESLSQGLSQETIDYYIAQKENGNIAPDVADQLIETAKKKLNFNRVDAETQDFVCLLGDQIAYGDFQEADTLPEDHLLKIVVSRSARGLLKIHAVFDQISGLAWLTNPTGVEARRRNSKKITRWISLFL